MTPQAHLENFVLPQSATVLLEPYDMQAVRDAMLALEALLRLVFRQMRERADPETAGLENEWAYRQHLAEGSDAYRLFLEAAHALPHGGLTLQPRSTPASAGQATGPDPQAAGALDALAMFDLPRHRIPARDVIGGCVVFMQTLVASLPESVTDPRAVAHGMAES